MALTKVTKTGITDNAIDGDKIEDGTVVAADIAPGTISSDKIATGTIANDKLANSSVTINNSAVSLGGSLELQTGTDWQAVTVADGSTTLNAEAGKGYFLDTNAGVIEVFLPSSPTRGDKVVLADYSGTFGTNQIIINTGGELLDSTAGNDFKVTTNNAIVELVYVDSAKGWLVKLNQAAGTTPDSALTEGNVYDEDTEFISATGGTVTTVDTDFKVHTFTGDGCFVVSSGFGSRAVVDYLVVGGGGAGGSGSSGGGGGAGGYREAKTGNNGCYTASPLANPTGLQFTPGTYPITVGAGGSKGTAGGEDCQTTAGTPGSNSIFSTITSAGGGKGAGGGDCATADNGGAGGGGNGSVTNGNGNTPPVSPPQGQNGRAATTSPTGVAGGGGGALICGPSNSWAGRDGGTTCITGSPITKATGGGGGRNSSTPIPADSGPRGGGIGGSSNISGNSGATGPTDGGNAGDNTGSGGGGGGRQNSVTSRPGGAGGKGIVIIRYKFQ